MLCSSQNLGFQTKSTQSCPPNAKRRSQRRTEILRFSSIQEKRTVPYTLMVGTEERGIMRDDLTDVKFPQFSRSNATLPQIGAPVIQTLYILFLFFHLALAHNITPVMVFNQFFVLGVGVSRNTLPPGS